MATQRQTLTVQLAHAKIRISELEQQLVDATAPKAIVVTPARAAYLAKPRTEWVRPAHMEAARQAAMNTGKVTLVSH